MAEENDFEDEISRIHKSEGEAAGIIEKAKKDAEKIRSEANDDARKIMAGANEKAVSSEKEILRKTRAEIESDEKAILSKAEKDSQKIISAGIPRGAIKKALDVLVRGDGA